MSARFAGKVMLITGATSGMGRAVAERVAAEGAKVVLAARGKEAGDALATRLPDATFVATDVTVEAEVAELVRQAVERYGRLDGVFNNVGAATALGPVTGHRRRRLERRAGAQPQQRLLRPEAPDPRAARPPAAARS